MESAPSKRSESKQKKDSFFKKKPIFSNFEQTVQLGHVSFRKPKNKITTKLYFPNV